ncbi:MAG: chromate transporter [Bacteroidia bacterium]|nr:MAG: chromate transporter [Bacteroidia bacterium]
MTELAFLFLKLGMTAFGGPAAHIAMMEDEVVHRKKWMTHEHFLDLLGATNLIPGPNSTEMAIHIGLLRGGWKGLILAGVCFIGPAVVITLLLAHVYVAYGRLPRFQPLIEGVRPAILAVIFAAVFRLSRPIIRKPFMVGTGLMAMVLNLMGLNEIFLLILSGTTGLLWNSRGKFWPSGLNALALCAAAPWTMVLTSPTARDTATLMALGLFFLKIGSVLYGSGYVLVAFLEGGLVETRHWLTQAQLLDAVAVGQFTPGPVLSAATFIGYVILGIPGALTATAGIFLPSFIFVLIISRFIPRLRNSSSTAGFLDGVNAASIGLMLAVTMVLAGSTLTEPLTWGLFGLAVYTVLVWNLNAGWIVGGSALAGWLIGNYL